MWVSNYVRDYTAAFVNELYKFQTNLRTLILFPYQYIIKIILRTLIFPNQYININSEYNNISLSKK